MQRILPASLPSFQNVSMLVIGDLMLDRYWFGDTSRISPEAPVPIVNISHIDQRLGGAGNVALNLKSLGCHPFLVSSIGNDEEGKLLIKLLKAAQIAYFVHHDPLINTIVKLRVISRHQQLLRADFENNLYSTDISFLISSFSEQLKKSDLVVLSDYKKGTLTHPQVFIQEAKKANVPILVDPKGNDFSVYAGADVITPNMKEFESVVGPCQNEEILLQKGHQLLKEHCIGALLITRGPDGMTLLQEGEALHLPACAREVVDITGAGDTVISTLGAGLAAKLSLREATALANLSASIAVSKLGAATVTMPELEANLKQQSLYRTGIVNEQQLLQTIAELRSKGKKIVFTNGCFDILHAGHVECLQLAKGLGDYLVVAVNTDESIQRLKGPHRPINHLEHRMTVLAGLGVVNFVVPFNDETPERLLRLLQPDVLVKGGEYRLDQVVGAEIVRSYGGMIRVLGNKISSSSAIIDRVLQTQPEVN